MIKNLKALSPTALIENEQIRKLLSNLDSEMIRGINTILILNIITKFGEEGAYGYQINKEIQDSSEKNVFIEEGTLYPLLKKMERDHLLKSKKKSSEGPTRKYYFLTDLGTIYYNYARGFLTQTLEIITPMLDLDSHPTDPPKFLLCDNCGNRIDIPASNTRFCIICGAFVETKIQELMGSIKLKKTSNSQHTNATFFLNPTK